MILSIIEKKKQGKELTADEIKELIKDYVDQKIPDYQMSAFLMAVWFQGMSMQETIALTDAMMHSGETLDLSDLEGITCDKHSTGGVGDKTSLVLVPLVAACGGVVAKMSGRGLGHTGGTIDKLESIPGFQTTMEPAAFKQQVRQHHCAIIGQSQHFVVADQMLYALRDVTATVDSIPLIASSILSKKLAAGSEAILLDVKYGEGAFMKTKEEAKDLADCMCTIGKHFNRTIQAVISDMNQPLGFAIGNTLEVKEAIDTLQGRGPADFTKLCQEEAAHLLFMSHVVESLEEGMQVVCGALNDGCAFNKFCEMVEAQGGDASYIRDPSLFPQAKYVQKMFARKAGTITSLHALSLGLLAMDLGAGRKRKGDTIDYSVGIVLSHKQGDTIAKDECLATVHSNHALTTEWIQRFYEAIEIQ